MQNKIKLIIAALILSSVVMFIIVLYIASAVMHKIPAHIAWILGSIVSITDITIAVIFITRPTGTSNEISLNPDRLIGIPYSDNLISIDNEGITIKLYYFPHGAKRINFWDIEEVEAFKGGSSRIWGSNDFRTWFGLDWGRMNRKMTFVIKQKNKWSRAGFTCQDSEGVAKILQSKIPMQIH